MIPKIAAKSRNIESQKPEDSLFVLPGLKEERFITDDQVDLLKVILSYKSGT
jgi:hypothetical protein